MTFDPELNLMYVGTGNGSPWARSKRSPAGGDNLYLASIVALNPDTGKYVWHYQETPGDNWDYTSTQPMILADLTIDGTRAQGHPARAEERLLLRHRPHQRQVHLGQELRRRELGHRLRHRTAGRSRRPRRARRTSRATASPARSARTTGTRCRSTRRPGSSTCRRRTCRVNLMDDKNWTFNAQHARRAARRPRAGTSAMYANAEPPKSKPFGRLIAWDPVKQKEAWRQRARVAVERRHADDRRQPGVPGHRRRPLRRLQRHDRRASSGRRRPAPAWSRRPVTYLVDGKQYVSVAVGWGGVYGIVASRHRPARARHRLHLRHRRQRPAARLRASTSRARSSRASIRSGPRRRRAPRST